MKTEELAKDFIHEKFIEITLSAGDTATGAMINVRGIKTQKHEAEKITFEVDTKIISTSEALKELLSIYKVVDVNVYDVDLETVIREMYAK
jgi:ABC-type uncharacterized transport system ATPase subunit